MTYIGNTPDDRRSMLDALGLDRLEDLFSDIPAEHRFPTIDLPPALSEIEVLEQIHTLSKRNAAGTDLISFIGAGAYDHFIPSVVPYLANRGEFATAYTPYQAEASQGTVQTIFEYQSMVADLLGMDVVNASHYDGATAVAEAAIMAVRATRGRTTVVFSGSLHPEYLQVAETYLRPQGIAMNVVDPPSEPGAAGPTLDRLLGQIDDHTACLVVQNPDFLGRLHDLATLADRVHERGALLVVHVDPIATALLRSPGSLGADIVTGEGQPLGIPLSFGGPYLGIFAARKELVRKMPGRIAGQTTDIEGRRGFVLTLNTREQHIRRDKATSNICTNQGLMALRAAIYIAAMGPEGLREAAHLAYQKAHYAADRLAAVPGCAVNDGEATPFFKEFLLTTPVPAADLIAACREHGVIPGLALSRYYPERPNDLLVAVTERASRSQIDALFSAVSTVVTGEPAPRMASNDSIAASRPGVSTGTTQPPVPESRTAAAPPTLPQQPEPAGPGAASPPVAASYRFGRPIPPLLSEISRPGRRAVRLPRPDVPPAPYPDRLLREPTDRLRLPEVSEQDVVRYFTRLSHANMSIDTTFYPLGSCTMKYNPKVNETVASNLAFSSQHPLDREEDAQGSLEVMWRLQSALREIAGFAEVSLQPAAGAQGELTGILMIRAYHESHGDTKRTKILVPDSAHGTNPATVTMAGFHAVEIPSGANGNVDLDALRAACGDDVAGLMITNPNTAGLFERQIREVIGAVHECGGLVYGDGANLNAILGVVRPGDLGVDVMHFNLHKTFSTPHGGGGPGAGPVGANERLAPYLPGPIVQRTSPVPRPGVALRATPEPDRFRFHQPERAIGRLKAFHGNFGMLLRAYVYIAMHGAHGLRAIAENAVLNANYLRALVRETFPAKYDRVCMHEFVSVGSRYPGVSTMDIAKRLLDYGFHAPTVYFPLIVRDALMIEPTESENRETLELFATTLAHIAQEAREQPDILHEAPHTTPLRRLDEVSAVRNLVLRCPQ
ncbi:MAG: aminomethyl-transferring glycine dehydrogenase subunit GcvPB [Spirochaetota bacterium]